MSLGCDCDAEFAEQRDQIRIGAVVEDQEAGVDGMRVAVERDVDGVGVAARIVRPIRTA